MLPSLRSRLALLLVVLSTCGVESARPLCAPEKAKLDKALTGRWVEDGGGKKGLGVVIVAKSGGLMSVTLNKGQDADPILLEGHVSQVGTLNLLNLRAVEDGKLEGGYVFVRYALAADGSLETWLMKDAPFIAAINAHQLKGGRTQYGGTTLDDSPENLNRFIAAQDPDALFEKFATFRKREG